MTFVVATWLALLTGPLLIRLIGLRRGPIAMLDGFVLASILGLVVAHLLPQSFELGGGWALCGAAIGIVVPPWVEHSLERAQGPWHRLMLLLGMVGLAVHAMLDGAGIASESAEGAGFLTLGVVLHRVPMGLSVWWVVRPRAGRPAAAMVLAVLAAGTTAGYYGARPLLENLPLVALASFQALVAGSLVHVVVGHEPEALVKLSRRRRGQASIGALLGMIMVVALALVHDESAAFTQPFLSLAVTSAPMLLAAFASASVMRAWITDVGPLEQSGRFRQALRGTIIGTRTPLCACDVVAFYRQLLARGASSVTALAFLVAAPALGLDAVLVSLPLLGVELASARVLAALALSWVVALVLGGAAQKTSSPEAHEVPPSFRTRLVEGARHGFAELVDHALPWFIAGLAAAALLVPLIERKYFELVPAALQVVGMALLGLAGYVTASAAMPVMAVLLLNGLSPGAALAFLLVAPVTGAMPLTGLARLHGRRLAVMAAGLMALVAIGAGLLANRWIHSAPSAGGGGLGAWAAAAALLALLGASLLRQGPRALVGRVLDPYENQLRHLHPHVHDDPHHAHAH
jgi:uncharacterized protein